jgi:hypothetical protein
MAISDWIKPKWKHSDPEVRRAAVEKMGPENAERLRSLALTDADNRVRVAAVERIDDEDFLREIAASTGNGPALDTARNRLKDIYRTRVLESPDVEIQRQIVPLLADEEILAEIACTVDDPSVRLLAAERISDSERLCELTRNNCGPRVGLAVVERLDAEALLQRVAESASSKKIKRAAREKLDALTRDPETPEAAEVAEAQRLCETMESLAEANDLLRLRTGIETVGNAWETLDLPEDHPLTERLDAARSAARVRERTLAEQESARDELVALCVAAEGLADRGLDEAMAELEALRNRLAAAESVAGPVLRNSVREHYRNRFEAAAGVLRDRRRREEARAMARESAAAAMESLCRQAEELAAGGNADESVWAAIRERWDAAGDASPELHSRMDAARRTWSERRAAAQAAMAAEQTEAADRLADLVKTVERAAEAEGRAGLESQVRKAREEWRSVPPELMDAKAELAPRFDAAVEAFTLRQREFRENREWEWWANLNRKEELCRVVEAMAEVETLEGMAHAVREAHQQWKEIGPVSRDQVEAVWERFSGACNRAYQRCLERKQALLETVREATAPVFAPVFAEDAAPESEESASPAAGDESGVVGEATPGETETAAQPAAEAGSEAQSDNQSDSGTAAAAAAAISWNEITETVKAAQAEWKAIGPLPVALAEGVRDEFRSICDRYFGALRAFYDARDAERQENLERKLRLCEAAEALADSEEWAETAGRIKALQREWREVGPVPREENQATWDRFRTACDAFFQRLKAREPEHVQRREELIAQAEARAAAAEAPDADMDAIAREIMTLQKEWKTADPVPPEMVDALWERFHEPCNRFFETYKGLLDERKSAQSENEAVKTELVAEAETLADSTDWRETAERLKALQQRWREVGPAPRRTEQALWNRFRSACDRFFQARNAHFDQRRQEREVGRHRREEICAAAEALALLVAPDAAKSGAAGEDEAEATSGNGTGIDMAAEQLRAGLDFKDEVLVPGNPKATWSRAAKKVRDFQAQWRETVGGRGDAEEALWQRFRTACDRVYAARPQDERSRPNSRPDSRSDSPSDSRKSNDEEARA